MIDCVVHKRMGKPHLLRDEFSKLQALYNKPVLRRAFFALHYSQRMFDVSDLKAFPE